MTKLFCAQEAKKLCPTLEHLVVDQFVPGFYRLIKTKFTTPCGHAVECMGIGMCSSCNNWFAQCRHCKPELCLPCLGSKAKDAPAQSLAFYRVLKAAAKTPLELLSGSPYATNPAAHAQPITTAPSLGPAKAESGSASCDLDPENDDPAAAR